MRRLAKIFVASAFSAWLAAPLVLMSFGAGSGFAALEKRRPAEPPRVSAGAIFDRSFYSRLADFFGDRLPLRVEAVAADAWIDLNVFGDSPSSEVLLGAEGWLFSRASLTARCSDEASPREVVATIRKIDKVLRASGRRFLLVVAPNKEAIYPEYLGESSGLAECARDFRRELRSRLEQAELAEDLDLWQTLVSLKQRVTREIYWPHDTHWTSESALEVTRRIVERLDPDLWDEAEVVISPQSDHRGDLADLIGLPAWDPAVSHEVDREVEIRIVKRKRGRFTRWSATGETFPQPVLIIMDSFGKMAQGNLSQFLADSTWVAWPNLPARGMTSVLRQFSRAEVIIIESVERALSRRFGVRGKDFPIHLVDHLINDLPAIQLDFELARGRGYRLERHGRLERPGIVPEAGPTRVIFDLPLRARDADRYVIVDAEASESLVVVAAKRRGQPWRELVAHQLRSVAGRQRLGVEIPPDAELVSIQPGSATLQAAWLVDLR